MNMLQAEMELEAPLPAATPDESIAWVKGQPFNDLPEDLYIPPDALQVFLEAFEGPLDLLLYLIRKKNLDILDIPVAEITEQYIEYVELMKDLKLELAGEYLAMAAILAEIKSRLLLPRSDEEQAEEADPRAELIRRLQEYERFKQIAEELNQLPQVGREVFLSHVAVEIDNETMGPPPIELKELVVAFFEVLKRADLLSTHKIHKEALSVREKMSYVLSLVNEREYIPFIECFDPTEGRMGVVVNFLAILELLKLGLIDIVQTQPFEAIYLKIVKSTVSELVDG